MPSAVVEVRHVVAWLPAVRAITAAALWLAIAAALLFPHLDLPIRALIPFGLPAAICRTVLALQRPGLRRLEPQLLGLSSAADALLLTILLDITGGPFNPFVVIYAAYVWLAAIALPPAWTGVVGLTALVSFGWLVVDHVQAGLLEHHRLNDFPTHLLTMWFAGAGVAELVSHYVVRARRVLAERQQQLDIARDRAARSERLASLTTLAAGAAHELSTPLATIAVASRELERTAARLLDTDPVVAGVRADALLIRSEVERCQTILDGMSGRAGGIISTPVEPLEPAAIVRVLRERLPQAQRGRLVAEIEAGTPSPAGAGAELVQVLSSLLSNAFDAIDERSVVTIRFTARHGIVRMAIEDRGSGMSDEARRRVGEPFFTTKSPGKGIGLGVFLARSFAERMNGTLEHAPNADGGTTAILELPALAGEQVTT